MEKKDDHEIEIKENLQETENKDIYGSSSDSRSILILVGVTVAIFLVTISGFKFYNSLTSANIIEIDQLHDENLNNQLNENEGYVYNGFSFVKADGLWWTELNKFGTRLKVPLHFAPKDLENISMKGKLNQNFNDGDSVYIAIDPDVVSKYYTLSISELSFNLVKGMDRIPVGSCTKENEACTDREIINCETANGKPVIELVYTENPGIEFVDTCIKISGMEFDIVRGVNRILYQWYGIMK
jgi:hypothetical protein